MRRRRGPVGSVKDHPIGVDTKGVAAEKPFSGSVRLSKDAPRAVIQATASGQWLLLHGADEVGTFESFGDAAARAVEEFGVGSYLVRTELASTVTLPASVVLHQS